MSHSRSSTFGVELSNVPLINLRWEFREYHNCSRDPHFLARPLGRLQPVVTRYFTWVGMPDAGASILVSRTFIGIESYVRGVVQLLAQPLHGSSDKFRSAIQNPFSLSRKGAAENFYNLLPAFIRPEIALREANPPLWAATAILYREVRNPLSHGFELHECTRDQFAGLMDHIASMYEWVDGWFDPENLAPGARVSVEVSRGTS